LASSGVSVLFFLDNSAESKPIPTGEILQIVAAYLNERAPNVGKLKVVGPRYNQVNVKVTLVATDLEVVSEVESRVRTKIEDFLHPLIGGKEGNGWDFGQIPSSSNFYSLFSNINGVKYIKTIEIKIDKNVKADNRALEKRSRLFESPIQKSALPCNGKHEINVSWEPEREE